MDRSVCFGSRMEFFHWLLLEGDPEVVQLCEYYPSVQLESREFVFDMWVRWRDGRQECREVLTGGSREMPEWAVLVHWAQERGYGCRLVTEQQFAGSMKRINNWRRMLPFVKYAIDNPDAELERAVLQRLRVLTDLPMRELVRVHPRANDTTVTAVVAKLLHSGKLAADLDIQHFGPNLLLHPAA